MREVSLYVRDGGEHASRERDHRLRRLLRAAARGADELPTTSQPSIGDFLAAYEPLLAPAMTSSRSTSRAASPAPSAPRRRPRRCSTSAASDGRIEVIDAQTACGGLGLRRARRGRRGRARGGGIEEVLARAREARAALAIWFCIDTLEYLQRGGRVGRAQAWLGGALKIKPILSLEAEITPVERVRTSGRAFERMVEYLRTRRDDGADGWVVQHIQAPDRAAALVARGRELFDSEPLWVSEVGPVIGTYTGPGLIGVGGVPARLMR